MAEESLVGEIKAFAERYLSPEMMVEIDAALGVCDAFEADGIYQTIQNILYDQSTASTELQLETFMAEINHALDEILKAHSITLVEGTSLHRKNQLLSALYRFQHYEDTHGLLQILESNVESEEKIGNIVSLLTTMDVSVFLEIVDSFDVSLITAMTDFLQDKEHKLAAYENSVIHKDPQLVVNLKHFFAFFGQENMAVEILNTNIDFGYALELYMSHFGELLITEDDKASAMNLLSIFMLGVDSYQNPMDAYRQHSEGLITDLARRTRIEALLKDLVVSFTNYKEALDVAKRVSSV